MEINVDLIFYVKNKRYTFNVVTILNLKLREDDAVFNLLLIFTVFGFEIACFTLNTGDDLEKIIKIAIKYYFI